MHYTKKLIVGGIVAVGVFIASIGTSSAETIIRFPWFGLGDTIASGYSLVHFTLPDTNTNNFQGGIFWLPNRDLTTPIELTEPTWSNENKTRVCRKQIRGLYYNERRWQRLLPMDELSLVYLRNINSNYNGLTVAWWWYTTCSGGTEALAQTAIYWQTTYTEAWIWSSNITAWLMYEPNNNTYSTTKLGFYPSLAYFNNETPLGYFLDSYGWIPGSDGTIWFIGGWFMGHISVLNDVATGNGINNLFEKKGNSICQRGSSTCVYGWNADAWLDTSWYFSILGNTLLSRGGVDLLWRQSILGNPRNTSSIIFSDLINTSDILNWLRKNANTLCVWKTWYTDISSSSDDSVVCINNGGGIAIDPLIIDLTNSDYNKKDFIIRWRDVILQWNIDDDVSTLNIFVDEGNLYLKPNTAAFNGGRGYWLFNKDLIPLWYSGNVAASPSTWYSYGQLLRWNIFINGLIVWFSGTTTYPKPIDIPNKYYVYGRVASLNTAFNPSTWRTKMLTDMFGSSEYSDLAPYVNLSSVFTWKCEVWEKAVWTDGMPCALSNDFFKNSALILMREYIPTWLLQ